MTRSFARVVIAGLALAIGCSAADACQGSKVLFEDKFTTADPTWGPQSDKFKIAGGKAIMTAPLNNDYWAWNTGFVFEDADICYTVTLVDKVSDPTKTYAGLMFWVADNQNFYVFLTSPNGSFKVSRRVAGQWVNDPIAWTPADALKQGPNQPNAVRVKLEGNTVTAEINGKQVISFHAQPPSRASAIGLQTLSGPAPDAYAFSDLKVTSLK
jgi:hypothetical protein